MELYIFRHGLSPTLQEAGVKSDAERPLSAEGREKTRKCAEGMRALGIEVELILSSPFLRAKETAMIAHDELKVKSAVDYSPTLAVALDVVPAIKELITRFKMHERIMIVGHEPHLTAMVGRVCGDAKLRIDLKKAGLAKIEISDASRELRGTLTWLLTPKILMSMV